MTMRRIRSRTAAWLAFAGMALNAFWPLLANAKPHTPALPSEICSATGQKHSGESSPGEAPAKSAQPSHCALCLFHAERGAALPCAKHVLFPPALAGAPRPAHDDALRPEAAYDPAAPPRAPPFLS